MEIKIYNSLTKKKEPLVPLTPKVINMYSCGVTVYDACHIGHARSLYLFDVIRRYLQFRGYTVNFVRNITDVDDKIINRALQLGKTSDEVSAENIAMYYRDLEALGVGRADIEPKATENIPEMITHISGLIERGFAYAVDGDVYFAVRKFPEYGKLSGQSVEAMQEAVRIEKDEKKRDPLDFALWKKSKPGEPVWKSPWGEGRPGWHIECSAMSLKHLKCETLDIHAGGRDLIFPHHENEIAQAEALTGKPFAKYWIHHGLLTINSQKMAKSLGNFITIQDALKKYPAEDLKMFFLTSHYASPIDYTDEKIHDAHKALSRFAILFQEADAAAAPVAPSETHPTVKKYESEFIAAMDDDFNTPRALSVLFDWVSEVYKEKGQQGYLVLLKQTADRIRTLGREIFKVFPAEASATAADSEVTTLLNQRVQARVAKNFKLSDDLRVRLLQLGVVVEDTPQGQRWRKA